MRKVTIDYRVPYADTDQMGVVYYGNYRLHDLAMAKWEAREFLKRRWKFAYPKAKRTTEKGRTFFDA